MYVQQIAWKHAFRAVHKELVTKRISWSQALRYTLK